MARNEFTTVQAGIPEIGCISLAGIYHEFPKNKILNIGKKALRQALSPLKRLFLRDNTHMTDLFYFVVCSINLR